MLLNVRESLEGFTGIWFERDKGFEYGDPYQAGSCGGMV